MSLAEHIAKAVDWCAPRPHVWISVLVAMLVAIIGIRRRAWPTLHDVGDLIISFAGLIGGAAVLKDAVLKTEAEMRGLAWPIVIGGVATVWISARSAWDRMGKIGGSTELPLPVQSAAADPRPAHVAKS